MVALGHPSTPVESEARLGSAYRGLPEVRSGLWASPPLGRCDCVSHRIAGILLVNRNAHLPRGTLEMRVSSVISVQAIIRSRVSWWAAAGHWGVWVCFPRVPCP